MALNIQRVASEKISIIKFELDGQLDAVSAPVLEKTVNSSLNSETKILILDLRSMSFISSAGLRIFAKLRHLMKQRSGLFLSVNPQPQVLKVFNIIKTVDVSSIFADDVDLDAYLKVVQQG